MCVQHVVPKTREHTPQNIQAPNFGAWGGGQTLKSRVWLWTVEFLIFGSLSYDWEDFCSSQQSYANGQILSNRVLHIQMFGGFDKASAKSLVAYMLLSSNFSSVVCSTDSVPADCHSDGVFNCWTQSVALGRFSWVLVRMWNVCFESNRAISIEIHWLQFRC